MYGFRRFWRGTAIPTTVPSEAVAGSVQPVGAGGPFTGPHDPPAPSYRTAVSFPERGSDTWVLLAGCFVAQAITRGFCWRWCEGCLRRPGAGSFGPTGGMPGSARRFPSGPLGRTAVVPQRGRIQRGPGVQAGRFRRWADAGDPGCGVLSLRRRSPEVFAGAAVRGICAGVGGQLDRSVGRVAGSGRRIPKSAPGLAVRSEGGKAPGDPRIEILCCGGHHCRFWSMPLRGRRGGV
jgi:hypothetical protein